MPKTLLVWGGPQCRSSDGALFGCQGVLGLSQKIYPLIAAAQADSASNLNSHTFFIRAGIAQATLRLEAMADLPAAYHEQFQDLSVVMNLAVGISSVTPNLRLRNPTQNLLIPTFPKRPGSLS